jgi:hypothetical protein
MMSLQKFFRLRIKSKESAPIDSAFGKGEVMTNEVHATPTKLENLLVKSTELAELIDCSPERINTLAAAGELPGLKLGRSWVFPIDALSIALNDLAIKNANSRKTEPVSVIDGLALKGEAMTAIKKADKAAAAAPRRRAPPPLEALLATL